jgi:hypothetical protein
MKPKRKVASSNFLARFWREFLFMHEFEFETDLPPEQCVAALRRLSETTQFGWGKASYRTITINENQRPYSFHAKHQYKQKNRNLEPIILVDGMIDEDVGSSMTLVSGTARFAPAFYMGLIVIIALWVLITITPMTYSSTHLVSIFMIISACVFWWSLYRQRNSLVASIEQVVRDGEAPLPLSKHTSEDAIEAMDEWADSFPSQKAKH